MDQINMKNSNNDSRKQHNTYLIDNDKLDKTSTPDAIDQIIEDYNKYRKDDEKYIEEKTLKNYGKYGYKIKFFYYIRKYENPMKKYAEDFLSSDSNFVNERLVSASSITFLWNKNFIFAITTGSARYIIRDKYVNNFGIKVFYSRREHFSVKSQTNLPISGNVYSRNEIYLYPVNELYTRKVFELGKEVIGHCDNSEILEQLFHKITPRPSHIKVIMKDYLQVSSSLSLKELFQFLDNIQALSSDFSKLKCDDGFTEIKGPEEIKKHKDILTNKLKSEKYDDTFALLPKDTGKYLHATSHRIDLPRQEWSNNVIDLADIRKALYLSNMKPSILDVKIQYRYQESDEVESCSLYQMLNHEYVEGDRKFIIRNGIIYKIEKRYIDLIDSYIDQQINSGNLMPDISELDMEEFSGEEDEYIDECVKRHPNCIKMHKKNVQGVEIADILIVDEKKKYLYFVHVKKSAKGALMNGGMMSYLTAQIETAQLTLNNALNYHKEREDLCNIIKNDVKNINEYEDLLNWKRAFVACIIPRSKTHAISEARHIKSIISKICIYHLRSVCTQNHSDFFLHIVK